MQAEEQTCGLAFPGEWESAIHKAGCTACHHTSLPVPSAPTLRTRPPAVQKWGYVAFEPGSSMEFEIDSRVAGSESETNRVVLSYLASYESMGVARVKCVSGCKCQESEIDALWQEKASMLMTAEFAVRAQGWAVFRPAWGWVGGEQEGL